MSQVIINKEGEDWSSAVATTHFYNENNTNTLGYEGYLQEEDQQAALWLPTPLNFKNIFHSQVLKQLKNNAEDNETFIEWYCERCKHNEDGGTETEWNEMFSSGIESINLQRYNCLEEGKFLTCGCDNCV